MKERHSNNKLYFKEQYFTLKTHILPLISKYRNIDEHLNILEVGCGYGGNLVPFIERGCIVTGIDIHKASIEIAKKELAYEVTDNLKLIAADIYEVKSLNQKFDIIFMKDTIEHIPDHQRLMGELYKLLKQNGLLFQGFPPWRNPFGGHQQMCNSKILSKIPWFHLLPRSLFKLTLKLFGETPDKISGFLTDVYDTRISIQEFKRIARQTNFTILSEQLYFINPNYEIKFGLKPRKLFKLFNIPYLRDFYTTTAYYTLEKRR